MSAQKTLRLIIGLTVVGLMVIGCGAPEARPSSSMSIPKPPTATIKFTSLAPPLGRVEPIPEGCIYMEFFSPFDTSAYERDQSGHISAVITPIGRIEPLQRQWLLKDFEEAIYNPDDVGLNIRYLPGVAAWEYLKMYLQPEDEIWTFGVLDTGFVVIREDNVFSIVVTDHSL
jgi:hypothetical protein